MSHIALFNYSAQRDKNKTKTTASICSSLTLSRTNSHISLMSSSLDARFSSWIWCLDFLFSLERQVFLVVPLVFLAVQSSLKCIESLLGLQCDTLTLRLQCGARLVLVWCNKTGSLCGTLGWCSCAAVGLDPRWCVGF